MNRRTFFKYSTSSVVLPNIITSLNASEYTTVEKQLFPTNFFSKLFSIEKSKENEIIKVKKKEIILNKEPIVSKTVELKEEIKQVSKKNKDVFLEEKYIEEFVSVKNKLKLVQNHVGYGNFNILGFDEMLKVAKYSNKIEIFTKKELAFIESIFYYDPSVHGFYGEKISEKITQTINRKETIKIPHTGHHLFKGDPLKIYHKMLDDVGESLILTSGIRSIVKQTKLFLDKIDSVDGNITIASKSLAPPAYTYHSIADFDVGKKGFGHANFTRRFALTNEFIKMRKLKYIDMRYTINNKDGVRYEPWHVKVI